MEHHEKLNLKTFLHRYSSENACLEQIKTLQFPNGITCKECKRVTPHYKVKKRMCYACQNCGSHVYPLAGSVFEKSTTPLRYWFYCMFLMINTRAGISAKQIERELGVTYKTAWRMMHQIRKLMAETSLVPLKGVVEVDETYVGGKGSNRLKWHGNEKQKQIVMGMIERGGKVYLKHVMNTGKWALVSQIDKHIDPKARIISDELVAYKSLKKKGYKHDVIKHKDNIYVRGDIHTQTIENMWSHLKRGIVGVYRQVSRKHLQAYSDEFAFRFNHRKNPGIMFSSLLSQISLVKMVKTKPFLIRAKNRPL